MNMSYLNPHDCNIIVLRLIKIYIPRVIHLNNNNDERRAWLTLPLNELELF